MWFWFFFVRHRPKTLDGGGLLCVGFVCLISLLCASTDYIDMCVYQNMYFLHDLMEWLPCFFLLLLLLLLLLSWTGFFSSSSSIVLQFFFWFFLCGCVFILGVNHDGFKFLGTPEIYNVGGQGKWRES